MAKDRSEIGIEDTGASPENLTSTRDGTVYFGNTAKGIIVLRPPRQGEGRGVDPRGQGRAHQRVRPSRRREVEHALGVRHRPARTGLGPGRAAGLAIFRSQDGQPKGTYRPRTEASATTSNRCRRDRVRQRHVRRATKTKTRRRALDVWLADRELRGVDGLSILADGALYANNFFNGKLFRVPVKEDGSAGEVRRSRRPSVLAPTVCASGPKSLLQSRGGDASRKPRSRATAARCGHQGGMSNAAGVTQVGETALVLIQRRKAVVVPMSPSPAEASSKDAAKK